MQPAFGHAITPPGAGTQKKIVKRAKISKPTALPPPKRRALQHGENPTNMSDSDTVPRDVPVQNSHHRSQLGAGAIISINQTCKQADSRPSLTEAGLKSRHAWSAILGRSIAFKPRAAERKLEDERRLMDAIKKSRGVNDTKYKKAKANVKRLEEDFLKTNDNVEERDQGQEGS